MHVVLGVLHGALAKFHLVFDQITEPLVVVQDFYLLADSCLGQVKPVGG